MHGSPAPARPTTAQVARALDLCRLVDPGEYRRLVALLRRPSSLRADEVTELHELLALLACYL
jgi:hypothetical protein